MKEYSKVPLSAPLQSQSFVIPLGPRRGGQLCAAGTTVIPSTRPEGQNLLADSCNGDSGGGLTAPNIDGREVLIGTGLKQKGLYSILSQHCNIFVFLKNCKRFLHIVMLASQTFCESWKSFLSFNKTNTRTARKIPFLYSFSGNCAASVLISTFMCL